VSQPLRVGIRIPPCRPIPELVDVVREAERLGLDDVWFPDSQLLWRDVFAVAAAAVAGTTRINVGTAVTNVVTRHPAVVASAARTVHEIAPGRFRLGLGVGNSSVAPIGLRASTGAEMRDRIGVIRSLLDGDEVRFGDVRSRLRDPAPDLALYMAASGPKNLRLAGEISDGVILLSGVTPKILGDSAERIREGAHAAGRSEPVPMTVSAFCRVTDDLERDARELKPLCLWMAQGGGAAFLALAGIHIDAPAHVPGVYPDLIHAEDWDAAVSICDAYVSDQDAVRYAREFCVYGDADAVVDRLLSIKQAGASAVFLQHVGSYDLPHELISVLAEQVLPRLA